MTRVPARAGPRVIRRAPALGWALAIAFTSPAPADESTLSLADLAAYRAALSGPGTHEAPPKLVGFRELWKHPATYQGRRVRVEGWIVRRFQQESFGTFPPLEEAWAFSPAGDPFCLVFPEPPNVANAPGQAVRVQVQGQIQFVGTFLKLVQYQGGDGPRLAPLIVGPASPVPVPLASDRKSSTLGVPGFPLSRLDWAIGLAAAGLVALVLARQHLRGPVRRPLNVEIAPAPRFEDAIAPTDPPPRSDSR